MEQDENAATAEVNGGYGYMSIQSAFNMVYRARNLVLDTGVFFKNVQLNSESRKILHQNGEFKNKHK